MEVIGHDAEGKDFDFGEDFAFAEESDEMVLAGVIEDEASVDDPGDAVVEPGWLVWRNFQACLAHARIPAEVRPARKRFLNKMSVP
jgi:hypothetical protein